MKLTKYLAPNGKRVYTIRQMMNDKLSWRIVTVPLEKACHIYTTHYSNQARFKDFMNKCEAQAALDRWAEAEGLFPYQAKTGGKV